MFLRFATGLQLYFLQFVDYALADDQNLQPIVPRVQTSCGLVRGYFHGDVSVFLGIPYAAAPIGRRKFQKPVDPEPWDGTLVADHYAPMCPQASDGRGRASEDCLYLNVFTPNFTAEHLLPVVIWFHGGLYETGASSDFSPARIISRFVSKGVVFVTFNYRLNFYGFFTLMDDRFPPNRGLWDQVHALKWIQRNIDRFGGDPAEVTLIGNEAGASSIALHLSSPLARGMFKRAILHSGTPFNPVSAVFSKPEYVRINRLMAEAIGCEAGAKPESHWSSPDLVDCISSASQDEIWNAWRRVLSENSLTAGTSGAWAPVFDGTHGVIPFQSAQEMASQVPEGVEVMLGSVRNEARFPSPDSLAAAATLDTAEAFNLVLAEILQSFELSNEGVDIASKSARVVYTDQHPVHNESDAMDWTEATKALASDYWMNAGVVKLTKLLAAKKSNRVYLYSLDYFPEMVPSSGLDIASLFREPGAMNTENHASTSDDAATNASDLLAEIWTTFAKTANPNSGIAGAELWRPFDLHSYACLSLSVRPKMRTRCHWTCDQFWNELVPLLENRSTHALEAEAPKLGCGAESWPKNEDWEWKEAHVYRIAICAVAALCICIAASSLYVIGRLKQRLKTYHLLAAVADLNFT